MNNNIKFKDTIVVGFALFAMFFGAGNLIFPPFLGVVSGTKWFTAFVAFLFADGGLALLGVIALTRTSGDMKKLFTRSGKFIGILIGTAMIICIGPLIAIPRTAIITYTIGIQPTLGSGINQMIFSIIFFVVVIVLTIRPSKVVDIVGAFLTPGLLICLAILIVKGIIQPLSAVPQRVLVDNVFVSGIKFGYQTLDGMAACIFAGIVIASVKQKGYTDNATMVKVTVRAGIIALLGLLFVYGGLAYLGAQVAGGYDINVDKAALVVSITEGILGEPGKVILAIIVALACLTTAIGLTSSCGNYFSELSGGKFKYETIVIVVSVISAALANMSINDIVALAGPILDVIYPAVVTYIFLGLFANKIKKNGPFVLGVWVALILGLLYALSEFPSLSKVQSLVNLTAMLDKWPGGQFGFFWIVPVVIAIIIGFFLPEKKNEIS